MRNTGAATAHWYAGRACRSWPCGSCCPAGRSGAAALRSRITALRGLARQEKDADAAKLLRSRIAALLPLWQEARDLARITAHYYDKEAHR